MPSRVLTIMFTDISGFTETTSASSRKELRNLISKHDTVLLPILDRFNGTLVKTIGDALMVTFESPTNAVLCGMFMQEKMREQNEAHPNEEDIAIRIAINQGEVEVIGEDVYGEPVNIAARIEGITDPGEIFFTEAVYLTMNKAEVPSSEVDEFRLKGLPESIRVYRVIRDENSTEYRKRIEDLSLYFHSPSDDSGIDFTRIKPVEKKSINIGMVAIAAILLFAIVGASIGFMMGASNNQQAGEEENQQEQVDPQAEMKAAIAKVEAILEGGQLDAALSQAEALTIKYPGETLVLDLNQRIIRAEVQHLIKLKQFDDAMALIEKRAASRPWLGEVDLKYDVRMAYAQRLIELKRYGFLDNVFMNLLKENPHKKELWTFIVDKAHEIHPDDPTRLFSAVKSATNIMRNNDDALSDKVAKIIYMNIHDWRMDETSVQESRKILSERYPKYFERVRADLKAEKDRVRHNAFIVIRDKGELSLEQEIAGYFDIITTVTNIRDAMFIMAKDKLTAITSEADWAEKRKALNLKPLTTIGFLQYSNKSENHVKMKELLLGKFPDLMVPYLLKAVQDQKLSSTRSNAWEMLTELKMLDRVDQNAFHTFTLTKRFSPVFNNELYHEAIDQALENLGKP